MAMKKETGASAKFNGDELRYEKGGSIMHESKERLDSKDDEQDPDTPFQPS